MKSLIVPTSYKDGYAKALEDNPEVARKYIAHTSIGDPLADTLIRDVESLDSRQYQKYIRLGMRGATDTAEFKTAPQSIKKFFEFNEHPPEWLDLQALKPGVKMFHKNTRLILAGMVGGVLVEGFSTNIAKSFFLTGRIMDKGIRRLQQNNRQMLEVFMPHGLLKYNDGWVLSIRIRLIHAKIRFLIEQSDEWDQSELGLPISSANLGFAVASFSARLLYFLDKLGGNITQEERASFMQGWRYSGYLMGVPESILYTNEKEALELNRIARICEPPPSMESIAMASSLINSAPLLAGISEPKNRRELSGYISKISRALIGDKLADALNYDKVSTFGVIWRFKLLNKIERFFSIFSEGNNKTTNMMTALEVSMYEEKGITYGLPDNLYSEKSSKW